MSALKFVNHASYLVKSPGVTLLCDPWYRGSAFNDGWDLLIDSEPSAEDLADLTHIWYSHEHPDHFSPAFLKQIPAERRAAITVIFQKTDDQKVLTYAKALGFKTLAAKHLERIHLGGDVWITVGSVPFYDSWLLVECSLGRILNLNDCVLKDSRALARLAHSVGRIDLLWTQFSYAAWKGGKDDGAVRREFAAQKLASIKMQTRILRPKFVAPFASLVYFSHVENAHMNDGVNTPRDAAKTITEAGSVPVILYPGDFWRGEAAVDNALALERYDAAFADRDRPRRTSRSVSLPDLNASYDVFRTRLRQKNNWTLMRFCRHLPGLGVFRNLTINLADLGETVEFDLFAGLRVCQGPVAADVSMHSQSLDFIFRHEWGFDTLTVNGRFDCALTDFSKLAKTFAVSALNNLGRRFDLSLAFDPAMVMGFMFALARFVTRARLARGRDQVAPGDMALQSAGRQV